MTTNLTDGPASALTDEAVLEVLRRYGRDASFLNDRRTCQVTADRGRRRCLLVRLESEDDPGLGYVLSSETIPPGRTFFTTFRAGSLLELELAVVYHALFPPPPPRGSRG